MKLFVALASICLLVVSFGCNSAVDMEKPIPVDNPPSEKTNSVSVDPVETVSPATQIDPIPPQDAAPDKVIKAFVRMLNSGDRTNAELLLTPSALTVISRAEFEIPPVGDAHCQCQFSEPQFATTKRKLCYVECDIFDKNSEDTTSVTWMMRKLQRGWRVAGMMIADESNDSVNLISFENSRDVNRLQIELDEDSANVSTSVNDTE